MKIMVGQRCVYTVEVRDSIVDGDGVECVGLCEFANRRILIAAHLDREQRRNVLRHEVYHAFDNAFPGARDTEQAADFHASVSDDLDGQIQQQGGWAVLDRLVARHYQATVGTATATAVLREPEEPLPDVCAAAIVEGFETVAKPHGGRASCGVCDTLIADGAIVTSRAEWRRSAGGSVVERTMYCPHCDHLQRWLEGATAGRPNGAIVREPTYVSDAGEVNAFLVANPAATGLIVGEG